MDKGVVIAIIFVIVLLGLGSYAFISLLESKRDIQKALDFANNKSRLQSEYDDFGYNACLQGCFNYIEFKYETIDKSNKTQEEEFIGCGNLCMPQFNQNFTW